jgi:hypothetical protein
MQATANSGGYHYKYTGTFSIVLLAVVDAECKFMYVDIGCSGRVSDGEVFYNRCSLYLALETGISKLTPQYLYLVRHSQFPISLLQTVHCHETLHYEALSLQ